jgi:nucleoside 2-deoxyribosyltransferase
MRQQTLYIAHNFAARDWLREEVVPFFTGKGIEVTSRWLTDAEPQPDSKEAARGCLYDVDRADNFLLFAKQVGSIPGRARYAEMGYAIHGGKDVYVCTNDEDLNCLFYRLPEVVKVAEYRLVAELLRIKGRSKKECFR